MNEMLIGLIFSKYDKTTTGPDCHCVEGEGNVGKIVIASQVEKLSASNWPQILKSGKGISGEKEE